LNGPVDHRWIRLDEIDRFPLPGANHKFIPLLGECESGVSGTSLVGRGHFRKRKG
jgi:hypothetical protein